MPLQKFDVYDIIVDIIPGIILTGLVLPLALPSGIENTSLPVGGVWLAIIILAIGYFMGRFLHSIASWFDKKITNGTSKLISFLIYLVQDFNIFPQNWRLYRVEEFLVKYNDKNHTVKSEIKQSLSSSPPDSLKSQVAHEFLDRVEATYEIDTNNLDYGEFIREYEQFSYSLLYDKQVLYRRYEILSTFFRSMYVLCLLAGILYTVSGLNLFGYYQDPIIWYQVVQDHTQQAILFVCLLFIFSIVFSHRKAKFSNKKGRALLYDSIIELSKENN